MKRTTPIILIAATIAMPCAAMAGAFATLPTLYESRKFVHVNRVDRISTSADLTWVEWPAGALASPASIAPALTPIDAPAPADDLSPSESEPAAIAFSSRVEPRRPKFDVGLTSQVVEGFARKLLGGLLGKVAGGLGRRAGDQLASSAMSFASTYALGQMAQRYYAGGRSLSALQLKELFSSLAEQARSLHGRYAGEIQQRTSTLNPAQLLNLVRGNPGHELQT